MNQNLNIALIYDNSIRPDTTGEYCKRALSKICQVEHFLPSQLNEILRGYDFYLNIDDGIPYVLPERLRPSAWWVIDTHLNYTWDLSKARTFDFVFSAQKDGAERLYNDGIKKVWWLPLACDPGIHKRCMNGPKIYDFSFVGNISPGKRADYLEVLGNDFPNHFIGNAYFHEMAKIYSDSKIVFNHSIKNDINMRVFEAMSCGSLLLTNDLSDNGQDELFGIKPYFKTFKSIEEACSLMDYYLKNENERARLANDGMASVLAEHTYENRMIKLVNTICNDNCFNYTQKINSKTPDASISIEHSSLIPKDSHSTPSYYDRTRPEIQALIPQSAKRILDVGCGHGELGRIIKARQNCEVVGVESVPDVAETAASNLDLVHTGDIANIIPLLPKGSFDCIVLADVLEHLTDPADVLKMLTQCLTPGGRFAISIPNVRHWSVIKGLLQGRWDYEEAGLLDQGHLRFFTKKSFEQMITDIGLQFVYLGNISFEFETIPRSIIEALTNAGLDISTLEEESSAYQLLYVAGPALKKDLRSLTSIIILAHNELEYTKRCVDSILVNTSGPYEMVIVDNGSSDGTAEHFEAKRSDLLHGHRACKNIILIRNDSNLGYAAANNQGIAVSRGKFVVLVNNDIVVTSGWLEKLIGCAEKNPRVGVVGPMSNAVSGSQLVPGVDYDTVSLKGLDGFANKFGEANKGRSRQSLRAAGLCMLINRSLIDKIGGLDEEFGLGNFEDDDYCIRAALAGFGTWIAEDCFIHHFGSRTFTGAGIDYEESLRTNWEVFKKKWDLPLNLDYGEPFDIGKILHRGFSHSQHFCPTDNKVTFPGEASMPKFLQEKLKNGEDEYHKGHLNEAEILFREIIGENREIIEASNNLVCLLWQEGRVEEALTELVKAMEIAPDNRDIVWNYGQILLELGKKEDAVEVYKSFLTNNSQDSEFIEAIDSIEGSFSNP